MSDFTHHYSSSPQGTDGEPSIRLAAGLLDGTLAALLVRCAFVGMELWMPSPGGVAGLGLIGALFVLAALTSIAWAAALSLRDNDR